MSYTLNRVSVGKVGVIPGEVELFTTNTLATITTAGYLSNNTAAGPLSANDIVSGFYDPEGIYGVFTVSASGGVNTLIPWVNPANVLLPVISGNFAVFNGTTGQVKNGKIPTDSTQPYVAMSAGAMTAFHLLMAADSNGTLFDSGIVANRVLTCSFSTPDTASNLIGFDTSITAAALAVGASVIIQASSLSKQYKIRTLQINSSGTNFSGGGGDRTLSITDGTTTYSIVPAASLQTEANATWGSTALPFPAGAAINTSTAAGINLVAKYAGGTTDYAAGTIVVSGVLQRVA